MNRILIVEDEPRIAAFLEKGFRANGFITAIVQDGQAAIRFAIEDEFDLIILDLGLPGKDGLLVLEELRGQGFQKPIIILTARDDVNDKVNGLEHGADDYVTKPFHFDELLARVRVRLRTNKNSMASAQSDMVLQRQNLRLDLRTRRVYIGDRSVELSAREFTLAETFLRHPDQVMSREQLLNHVWGYDYDPGSNIVDVYVGYLRKKLGDDLIETVRGVGYRMRS
ncbi:response regulator transcription factor [Thermocoleostomius sinensis]|uniref:Response regulator transcription factor n=1 Tax=Thermocoleostomius sinensis A174 TaxID=2016057 RepID=A0A9E9C5Z4_9CYAN|nr:response regulator transcription factor [Thermocoleostomius sinensis]WAL58699.1 response regulator transcription factor [Thermocoleostomius sinensis A174]